MDVLSTLALLMVPSSSRRCNTFEVGLPTTNPLAVKMVAEDGFPVPTQRTAPSVSITTTEARIDLRATKSKSRADPAARGCMIDGWS